MIATVTLNPSLDEHITVSGLIVEEANRWQSIQRYAGGKGIDVSRAIHEMNGTTVAYGFIGGPNGRLVEIMLDEEGVPYDFTPISEETRSNFIITDSRTAQQTRIGAPGPRITEREMERFTNRLRRARPHPDLLAAGGSVPPGVPADIYYTIVNESRDVGVRTILDSAGHWLIEGLKARPYLIKPNVHEAEGLLSRDLPDEAGIIEGAMDLVAMGVEVAVISCGEQGVVAATSELLVKAVPPPVDVVSAVGAGDCTIAGLALRLQHCEPLADACRLAVAMGTAAVTTPGTELCHREDVERLLPQVEVHEVPASRGLAGFPAPAS
jgi:6-phosphofructokinase 2